jgi:hypothetical protein
MKELFVMVAKAMSKEQVIEKIQDSIAEYHEAKLLNQNTENAEHSILFSCHLYIMNDLEKDAMEIIKEMDTVNKRVKFFDTEVN